MSHYFEVVSEDSDSMQSRASSMDSDWQLNNAFAKVKKPCREEENDNTSLSSADETDNDSFIQVHMCNIDTIIGGGSGANAPTQKIVWGQSYFTKS